MDRVLGRIRKGVFFFHQSITPLMLKTKQEILPPQTHKLIHDVPTRWKSTSDMFSAFYSALTRQDPEKTHHHLVWWWRESGRKVPPGAQSPHTGYIHCALKLHHLCPWSYLWKQRFYHPWPQERKTAPSLEMPRLPSRNNQAQGAACLSVQLTSVLLTVLEGVLHPHYVTAQLALRFSPRVQGLV